MDRLEVVKPTRNLFLFKINFLFSMAGNEEKLGRDVYISDESEGIIPRASINKQKIHIFLVRYLW